MFLKIFLLVLFMTHATGLINIGEKREEASKGVKATAFILTMTILTLLAYFIIS